MNFVKSVDESALAVSYHSRRYNSSDNVILDETYPTSFFLKFNHHCYLCGAFRCEYKALRTPSIDDFSLGKPCSANM